jgi:hypothetical protein
MNEKRKKLFIRMLVALVALWIAGQAVVSVVRYVHDREAHQEAEAWLQQAQQGARNDLTPTDAARWLRQNGAGEVYRGETVTVNGQEVERHVIMGSRKVSTKCFWTDPLTAQLMFHFDTDWHFANLELECLPYELHWLK